MSAVPSVSTSTSTVLPGLFATAGSKGSGQQATQLAAEPVADNSTSFAIVLNQNSTLMVGPALPESEEAADEIGATMLGSGDTDSEETVINQQPVSALLPDESDVPLNAVPSVPFPSAINPTGVEVTPLSRVTDADRSTEVDEGDETDVNGGLLQQDGTERAVIPNDLTRQKNDSATITLADNVDELESVNRSSLQVDGQAQNHNTQYRDGLNAASEVRSTALDDLDADVEAKAIRRSESLQQLRSELQSEFGLRPDNGRQASNRTSDLQGNLVGHRQSVDPSAATSGPQVLPMTHSQTLGGIVAQASASLEADEPLTESVSKSVNPTSMDSKQNTAATHSSSIGDPSEPLFDPLTQMPDRANVKSSKSTVPEIVASVTESTAQLESSVNAGVARTERAEAEINAEADRLQNAVSDSDAVEANRSPQGVDLAGKQTRIESHEIHESASASILTGLAGGPSAPDDGLTTSFLTDGEPQTQLLPDTIPLVDSDLDLLQQLLPRETSTVFGQSVESTATDQQKSLDLPRQIAARALGEAEVLEPGDSSRFRMKLDPPELGSVLIDMQKTARGTTITVTAADPATQQLLQDSLQQLNQSDSGEPSVFDHLNFDLSSGDQGDDQDRDSRKSHAEKIRVAGVDSAEADSDSASQSTTELDFVA